MRELYRRSVLWVLRKALRVMPKGSTLRKKIELLMIKYMFKR